MRCHFSDKDEETNCNPTGLTIWASSTVQNPSVLKSVDNISGTEEKSYSDELSTLYSLDSVSQSYKRKILECEKEDFEERFSKIQRKRQMLRATARASLVVDDDDDDYDEEGEIYEQMEWIEDESNAMTLHLWKEKDVDLSFQSICSNTPLMYIPKLNLREERRHVLRISMAKIRGVDDPETYLRRSVLINNTVKRLQKDVAANYRCHSLASSSLFQENITYHNESNEWDDENIPEDVHKHHSNEMDGMQYSRSISNKESASGYTYSDAQTNPYNFQLSLVTPLPSDKHADTFQNEVLHNSPAFSKSSQDDLNVCDPSVSCRTLKQTSPVHVFSSQPCGLQFRNSTHEDTNNEYESSSSSSILDSVVYHSLIASLET